MADKLQELMAAQAQRIAGALRKAGYAADFSIASLREIDRFLEEQAVAGQPKPGGFLSKDLGARLFALGAYIGEVIRQQRNARWIGDVNDPELELTVGLNLPDGSTCYPTQRIMKRFATGSEDGIAAWGAACGLEGLKARQKSSSANASDVADTAHGATREFDALASESEPRSGRPRLLSKRTVQIVLAVWLLMAFVGGWYPPIALIAMVLSLIVSAILLAMSWWDAFRYAWNNEPGYCLFFLFPFYFIRYATLTLPHTKRSLWLLAASIVFALGSFLVLIPVQMAGVAVAGLLGQKPVPVVAQKAAAKERPNLHEMPRGLAPGIPADQAGGVPRQPTDEERAAARRRNAARKPQSIDQALANLDSTDAAARQDAAIFISKAKSDPTRPDVADKLLALLQDDSDPTLIDGVVRWGGPSHLSRMDQLVLRMKGYQTEKLLRAMLKIDQAATLKTCGVLMLDPKRQISAKSVLRSEGAASEPVLISLLNNPDREVRYAVVEMLYQHGTPGSIPALTAQEAQETDTYVKRSITGAIHEIKRRDELQQKS